MAVAIYENAEELGKMAVEETGMGDPEHKVMKNIGKSTGCIGRNSKASLPSA